MEKHPAMEKFLMHRFMTRAALGGCLLLGVPVLSGWSGATAAEVTPPADGGFYQALGGKEGVAAIVADFVDIMLADKRLNATFDGVDLDRLRAKLAEQFCVAAGGPCTYSGKSMAESHEDLKATNAQFNASVENLQAALDRHAIPARVQNRLLARLAPTQRDIVTK